MAISFFQTAAWNTSGTMSGLINYKDVVLTGVASGDLIVVVGASENYGAGGGTRAIATQAGATTGSWTLSSPGTVSGADVDVVGGWALATSSGTVTVRVSLRQNSAMHMGVGAWLIPAAEIGSTYGWMGTSGNGFAQDADGQLSITLSATSTVLYGAGDWSATAITSTASTPVASNYRVRVTDTGLYSVYLCDWTSESSGTRSYGPAGLSGKDFSGVIFRMDVASGGAPVAGTLSASVPVLTGSVSGASVNVGTMNASTPRATTSISGSSTNTGSTSASVPVLTSSVTGSSTLTGTVSAPVPRLTTSISDTSSVTGTLSASTIRLTSSIAGQSVNVGTVAASVIRLTSAISGTSAVTGALAASVPVLRASVVGTSKVTGTVSARVPLLTMYVTDAAALVPLPFPLQLVGDAVMYGLRADYPSLGLYGEAVEMNLEG